MASKAACRARGLQSGRGGRIECGEGRERERKERRERGERSLAWRDDSKNIEDDEERWFLI
jgi:hypothetical protein